MKQKIKVIPNSKQEKIFIKDGILVVKIKEKLEKGKANAAVIKVLENYFNKKIRIVSGFTSKNKVIELAD